MLPCDCEEERDRQSAAGIEGEGAAGGASGGQGGGGARRGSSARGGARGGRGGGASGAAGDRVGFIETLRVVCSKVYDNFVPFVVLNAALAMLLLGYYGRQHWEPAHNSLSEDRGSRKEKKACR